MAETKDPPIIVLIGDFVSHTLIERGSRGNTNENPSHHMLSREAHVRPLLPAIIANALQDGWKNFDSENDVIMHPDADARDIFDNRISILDRFPKSSRRKDGSKVLRVSHDYLACDRREQPSEAPAVDSAPFNRSIKEIGGKLEEQNRDARHRITVIYDQNGYTRDAIRAGKKLKDLGAVIGHDDLIIGINSDISKWCYALDNLKAQALLKEEGVPATTLVTSADALRKAGVNIRKYGALEHSIHNIVCAMDQPPISSLLESADDLVIIFRETGSLHIRNNRSSPNNRTAALHYCPNFDRVAQADKRGYGHVPAKFAIFLAAIVKGLSTNATKTHASIGWEQKPSNRQMLFDGALRLAAVAYNHHFSEGLLPQEPFKSIERVLSVERCDEMAAYTENDSSRDYLSCTLELKQLSCTSTWSRTSKFLNDKSEKTLVEDLRKLVVDGMDQVLVEDLPARPETLQDGKYRIGNVPWFPRSYITVPYVAFNDLKLVDTEEIAQHFELAKIIGKYIETHDWRSPLSIAVFGKPGSGKSFAVTQILKYIDPTRKTEPLTFNLAQFSTVDQLTDAFHQIQDRALSSDEVPLAIFDEFDSICDKNRLGWLKYFLAPMQDGLFRGKSGDYRVGRVILLFSGGTRSSYRNFVTQTDESTQTNKSDALLARSAASERTNRQAKQLIDGESIEEFKRSSKLIDFLSRLRGYLDVSDLNCDVGDPKTRSNKLKLRRAVLLRSLLEKNAKPIMVEYSDGTVHARIDKQVIDAFLGCEYVYGVRSMEAIIQMSRWIEGRFVPASLPIKDLLQIHVKGDFLTDSTPP
jgi:hypothetical protein